MPHQHLERLDIELDLVGAVRLRGSKVGAIGPFDQCAGEGDRGPLLVDVAPPKGQELTAAGSRRDREPQVAEQRRVLAP
jgi:hypothetical protein